MVATFPLWAVRDLLRNWDYHEMALYSGSPDPADIELGDR
jgi:hypothetical protein